MASGSLGALVVSMAVDTAKFQGDLGRAAAIAERRMKNIKDTASRAFGALTVAATAAGTALTAVLTRSLQNADGLFKLSQQLGTTVEKLSALEYGAKLADVSREELTIGLRKLASTADDAAKKADLSGTAFGRLGIQVKNADGTMRPLDALLEDIADKFSAAADGTIKTALAQDLLGKSGSKLIPLLNQGSAGLAAMAKEANSFGQIISTETAVAAEQFNDNLTRLQSVGSGFGNLLAAELAPTLVSFTDSLVTGAAGFDELRDAARSAATFIRIMLSGLEAIRLVVVEVGKGLGALAAAIAAVARGEVSAAIDILNENWRDSVDIFKHSMERIAGLWEETAETTLANAPRLGSDLAAPITSAVETARAKVKEFLELERQMRASGGGLIDLTEVDTDIERTADPELDRMLQEQAEQNEKVFTEMFDNIGEDFKSTMVDMSVFAEQGFRNLQSHAADFLFDPFDKGLKGMLKGFIDVIRRMIAEAAAAQIFETLFKGFGGGGGGGFLGTLLGGLGGGIKLPRGVTPTVPSFGRGFASGGFMRPGEIGMVGERGPEFAMAGRHGATIVPFEKVRGGQSQSIVVNAPVSIDARGATQDAVKELYSKMPSVLKAHGEQVEARIIEGLRRNRYRLSGSPA